MRTQAYERPHWGAFGCALNRRVLDNLRLRKLRYRRKAASGPASPSYERRSPLTTQEYCL